MGSCITTSDEKLVPGATDVEIIMFIQKIDPLDLIVFKGDSTFSKVIAKLEKFQTGSGEISHVEVAINQHWCSRVKSDTDTDFCLSWGSTLSTGDAPNVETGEVACGVQIRSMSSVIKGYLSHPGTNVGLCKLLRNPIFRREGETTRCYDQRVGKLRASLDSAYDDYNGLKYNANPIALLGSVFPQLRPIREKVDVVLDKVGSANDWLFCSEFVALLYQRVGVIDDSTNGAKDGHTMDAKDVLPVDFLGYDADSDGLVNPICQSPPLWLVTDKC